MSDNLSLPNGDAPCPSSPEYGLGSFDGHYGSEQKPKLLVTPQTHQAHVVSHD